MKLDRHKMQVYHWFLKQACSALASSSKDTLISLEKKRRKNKIYSGTIKGSVFRKEFESNFGTGASERLISKLFSKPFQKAISCS